MQNILERGVVFEATNGKTGPKRFKVIDEYTLTDNLSYYKSLKHPDFKYLIHQALLKGTRLVTPTNNIYISDRGTTLHFSDEGGVLTYSLRNVVEQGIHSGGTARKRKRNSFGVNEIWLSTAPYVYAGFSKSWLGIYWCEDYDVNDLYDKYVRQALEITNGNEVLANRMLKGIMQTHHINKDEGDDTLINLITLPRHIHSNIERKIQRRTVSFYKYAEIVRKLRVLDSALISQILTNSLMLKEFLAGVGVVDKLRKVEIQDLINVFDPSILGDAYDPFYEEGVAKDLTVISYIGNYFVLGRDDTLSTRDKFSVIMEHKTYEVDVDWKFVDEIEVAGVVFTDEDTMPEEMLGLVNA